MNGVDLRVLAIGVGAAPSPRRSRTSCVRFHEPLRATNIALRYSAGNMLPV